MKIVVGVLLLLALREWRGRPRGDAKPQLPRWMKAIDTFTASKAAGTGASRCVDTCVPTASETPIERGSVIRCGRQGVNRENGSGSRASPGRRAGATLPRVRGALHQADRGSSWSLAGDDQGVFLRSDRREGEGGQGALCRRVSRLRRLHPVAEREGGRLRLLQGVPPGRDRGPVDSGARARRHAALEHTLRSAAVVVRLVAHARASLWRRAARATQHRRLAFRRRRDRCLRELAGGTGCSRQAARPGWR